MKSQLVDLMSLDRRGLVACWQKMFGCPAPLKAGSELLRQIIGWEMQAKASGGIGVGDQRRLKKDTAHRALAEGSRLVRVWRDETHQVTVLSSGFLYDGKIWRSLSAIAKAITGTPWSGPAFFGIKDR